MRQILDPLDPLDLLGPRVRLGGQDHRVRPELLDPRVLQGDRGLVETLDLLGRQAIQEGRDLWDHRAQLDRRDHVDPLEMFLYKTQVQRVLPGVRV